MFMLFPIWFAAAGLFCLATAQVTQIHLVPKKAYVKPGTTATLKCVCREKNDVPCTLSWYRGNGSAYGRRLTNNGFLLNSNGSKYGIEFNTFADIGFTSTLHITDIGYDDGGLYTCSLTITGGIPSEKTIELHIVSVTTTRSTTLATKISSVESSAPSTRMTKGTESSTTVKPLTTIRLGTTDAQKSGQTCFGFNIAILTLGLLFILPFFVAGL
ncbi:hypothetical protein ScPMuIL_008562 [Solemya velum]